MVRIFFLRLPSVLLPGILFLFYPTLRAQSVYAPLNADYYHLIDRYEIRSGRLAAGMHTHVRPLLRQAVVQLADSMAAQPALLSARDRFNLGYLRNDSWEWAPDSADNDSRRPILRHFYRKKSDLFAVQTDDFDLHVNPVLYLSAGTESGAASGTRYTNTRGAEIRGMISRKIGFYSFLADNQAVMPAHVQAYTNFYNAVPYEGYWKRLGTDGVDFITARGYLTFHVVKPVMVQFGHDKNFIGGGHRSLILGDGPNAYPFLKINTKVWKLNYMNVFAQMTGDIPTFADALFPKKYFAFHHLSINLARNLNVGLFESVMFGRPDPRRRFRYDFHYYNPIIFYRYVEQQLGSEDNSIIGLDVKWNFLRHFQVYGQLVIDEFLLSRVRAGTGWWANKQAVQAGVKYVDALGVRNLDLHAELNVVRPYTYAHSLDAKGVSYGNYVHYNLPLAHPLGANFMEWVGLMRYQPLNRLHLTGKLIAARYGTDGPEGEGAPNWGGNIRKDYGTFKQEFGNRIGQGIRTSLLLADLTAAYQLKHNMFLDARLTARRQQSSLQTLNSVMASLNFRWNIAPRIHDF